MLKAVLYRYYYSNIREIKIPDSSVLSIGWYISNTDILETIILYTKLYGILHSRNYNFIFKSYNIVTSHFKLR